MDSKDVDNIRNRECSFLRKAMYGEKAYSSRFFGLCGPLLCRRRAKTDRLHRPKGTEKEGKVSDTVEAYRMYRTEDDPVANEVYNYGIDMTGLVKQMTYQDFSFKR